MKGAVIIKNFIIKSILFLIILILSSPSVLATNRTGKISGDRVQYYRNQELIIARGNAQLNLDQQDISADYIEINLKENELSASGRVEVKNNDGVLHTKNLDYDLEEDTAVLIESEGVIISDQSQDPVYVQSPELSYNPDQIKMVKGEFTACDVDQPHYHLQASKMTIYPGDKIIAYNVVLWEFNGRIPIMYLPIVVYSLGGQQNIGFEVGSNQARGWFVKTRYDYYFNNYYDDALLNYFAGDFGQVYLDHYSKSGFAGGFKHFYRTLKNDNAHLYFYLDQDKRNPVDDPWITLELNHEWKYNHGVDSRKYNFEYRNYYDEDLSDPEKGLYLDYNYAQDLKFDNWDTKLNLDYTKDKNYINRIKVDSYFDKIKNKADNDNLGLDIYYDLAEKSDLRFNSEYDINLDYRHYFSPDNSKNNNISLELDYNYEDSKIEQEIATILDSDTTLSYEGDFNGLGRRADHLELSFNYNNIEKNNWNNYNNYLKEYQFDLGEYKKYLSKDLYLRYTFDYQQKIYQDKKDQLDSGEAFEYLTNLRLGAEKRYYDWFVEGELKERDIKKPINTSLEEREYYNLPKAEVTIKPGQILKQDRLKPLELSLGGVRRYHYTWQDDPYPIKEHGYFRALYDDIWSINSNNKLDYLQSLQQNIYSTNQQDYTYESELNLNTSFNQYWSNQLHHEYRISRGGVMEGFEEAGDDLNKIKWKLNWRRLKSKFQVETGYSFWAEDNERYDPLESSWNYFLNDNYNLRSSLEYDLNNQRFEDMDTSLIVDYPNVDYQLRLDFNYNEDLEHLEGKWGNDLKWKFGEKNWEWILALSSNYNMESEEFEEAKIDIEKILHCRKISLSYDYTKEEVSFLYQIFAFGGQSFGINSKQGQLSVGSTNLGGGSNE